METTGEYASWINEENEQHNIIIPKMVIAGLINIDQHEKWCCEAETPSEVYR